MRVLVERRIEVPHPGKPLTFSVPAGEQVLPRAIGEAIVASGAGRAVDHQPGDRSGGIAALIARKQRR